MRTYVRMGVNGRPTAPYGGTVSCPGARTRARTTPDLRPDDPAAGADPGSSGKQLLYAKVGEPHVSFVRITRSTSDFRRSLRSSARSPTRRISFSPPLVAAWLAWSRRTLSWRSSCSVKPSSSGWRIGRESSHQIPILESKSGLQNPPELAILGHAGRNRHRVRVQPQPDRLRN